MNKLRFVTFLAAIFVMPITITYAQAPAFSVVYAFPGGAQGNSPIAGPISLDKAGNIYGSTTFGGDVPCNEASGCGVLFKVNAAGTESVLYNFPTYNYGYTPVVLEDGALYGTTYSGGTGGLGTVFKIAPTGGEQTLYNFHSYADGVEPTGGVLADSQGNLYGTTIVGGVRGSCENNEGCGVIFKLSPNGVETVLHSFLGSPTDGGDPQGPALFRDSSGNLYGTTQFGGSNSECAGGCGTVFKLTPEGTETVLYNFSGGSDGAVPWFAPLIEDPAGNLYGTTTYGGDGFGLSGDGVVFKLDQAGTESVLYTFTGGADGAGPFAGLVRDKAGNLYGTTLGGGAMGNGVIFKLDSQGNETVLHAFTGGTDGAFPASNLALRKEKDGTYALYGSATAGGDPSCKCGTIFKLTFPAGNAPF